MKAVSAAVPFLKTSALINDDYQDRTDQRCLVFPAEYEPLHLPSSPIRFCCVLRCFTLFCFTFMAFALMYVVTLIFGC